MRFNATIAINRPAEEVYEFVTSADNDTYWRTGVLEAGLTSPGQLRVGTTGFAATGSGPNNRSDWQVIDLVEYQRVTWRFLSGPFVGIGGYRFEGDGDSTTFTLVADIRLCGWRALLWPLVAIAGPRQNRGDVEKLKALLDETCGTSIDGSRQRDCAIRRGSLRREP